VPAGSDSVPSQTVEPQSLPAHAGQAGRMPLRDHEQSDIAGAACQRRCLPHA
jgi:hypothetical protein